MCCRRHLCNCYIVVCVVGVVIILFYVDVVGLECFYHVAVGDSVACCVCAVLCVYVVYDAATVVATIICVAGGVVVICVGAGGRVDIGVAECVYLCSVCDAGIVCYVVVAGVVSDVVVVYIVSVNVVVVVVVVCVTCGIIHIVIAFAVYVGVLLLLVILILIMLMLLMMLLIL